MPPKPGDDEISGYSYLSKNSFFSDASGWFTILVSLELETAIKSVVGGKLLLSIRCLFFWEVNFVLQLFP